MLKILQDHPFSYDKNTFRAKDTDLNKHRNPHHPPIYKQLVSANSYLLPQLLKRFKRKRFNNLQITKTLIANYALLCLNNQYKLFKSICIPNNILIH